MSSLWNEEKEVYLNSFCFGFRITSPDIDPVFFAYLLRSDSCRKNIVKEAQGISRYNLSPNRLKNLTLNIPSIDEQQKIASFFSALDEKICNLEKQISCIDILKRTIYSKLFSRQNIASWNRAKFFEEFSFKRTFSLSRKEISIDDSVNHSGQKIIHYGDILTIYGDIVNPEIDKIGYVLNELSVDESDYLKDGDVIFADAAEDYSVGKAIELIGVSTQLLSGLHTIAVTPKNSFASGYLSCYFNSPIFKSQVKTLAVGTKVMSLTKSAIKTTDVYYPSLQEQEKISNLFFYLEEKRKIVLVKISTIKKLKSAFMQQMFV